MKKSIYQNYEELPLFLNSETVAKVLGVSSSSAYELMHESADAKTRKHTSAGPAIRTSAVQQG